MSTKRLVILLLNAFSLLALCALVALFTLEDANAAKMFVTWVAPTQNTDGSTLVDLVGYRIEWGSCSAPNVFGKFQSGFNVPATVTRTAIYPTNLAVVCAHVFAINSKNVLSAPSNTASGTSPQTLSQPVH